MKRALGISLIWMFTWLPVASFGQFQETIMARRPKLAGPTTPSLAGWCWVANFDPTSGDSSCAIHNNSTGAALTLTTSDIIIVNGFTNSTSITTCATVSAGTATISWGTTQTGTAVHQMCIVIGTVTGGGTATIQMVAATSVADNGLAVYDCRNCAATPDPALSTSNFKSGGFGSPTTTPTLTTTVSGDFLCASDFSTNTVGTTFTSISWSDSTTVITPAISNTATFTNSSASISATNAFIAGQTVSFTTTGGLPTNFATSTNYFVLSAGLSTSAFEVAATAGGTAITAGSAGTGTQTVVAPMMGLMNGSQGVAGVGFCGIQAAHAAIHGIFTSGNPNGDAVYVTSIEP